MKYNLPFLESLRYKRIENTGMEEVVPHTISYEVPPNAPVVAVEPGRVIKVERCLEDCIEGEEEAAHQTNLVMIAGNDGFTQVYVHVDPSVSYGDRVTQGQPLGKLFGYCDSDLPHLHFFAGRVGDSGKFQTEEVEIEDSAVDM